MDHHVHAQTGRLACHLVPVALAPSGGRPLLARAATAARPGLRTRADLFALGSAARFTVAQGPWFLYPVPLTRHRAPEPPAPDERNEFRKVTELIPDLGGLRPSVDLHRHGLFGGYA